MGIFGEYKINVTSGELGGDSGDKVFLAAPSLLATQYQAIEKSLLQVPGVKRVRRIALIPSERRHFELDTLLRHVAEPVLSVDREGGVVAANLAAARTFGVSLDKVPGLQLQRFLPRLQVAQLLRDFAAPRYGLPVSVRGRHYRLEWSPIELPESPGGVRSLAGAVLTLQAADAEPAGDLLQSQPLWDFDARRTCCLQLRELAQLNGPLLITGEPGSGKSTFALAAHYLSPRAGQGECHRPDLPLAPERELPAAGTLILEDIHRLSDAEQRELVRRLGAVPPQLRPVATTSSPQQLIPALAQRFSTLTLHLPPLRAMRPALGAFAGAMLRDLQAGELAELEAPVLEHLRGHDWPDNFSGLADHLAAALVNCHARKGKQLEVEDLPELRGQAQLPWRDWGRGLNYRQMMEQVERALLAELVQEHPSTRELAKRLGISHTAVANKLRKYRLGKCFPR